MIDASTLEKMIVCSLFALLGMPHFALAVDEPVLRTNTPSPVEIIQISPSQGDLGRIERKRKLEGIQTTNETQMHVVKVYVDMPVSAQAAVLQIGDEKITEYGGFSEGIFFKVYDAKQLEVWQGKPIRFTYRGQTIALHVTMPAKPPTKLSTLPTLADALKPSVSE